MNSFVVGLINFLVSTFKRLVISWSIKQFGTNCRFLQMGRIVAFSKWDELTLGTNCRFLEFVTNCRLGRIVAQPSQKRAKIQHNYFSNKVRNLLISCIRIDFRALLKCAKKMKHLNGKRATRQTQNKWREMNSRAAWGRLDLLKGII